MILFVDDEPWYVDSYVQELKLSGYDVHFQNCQDGMDTAAEFFERNERQVELLILDIIMPPGSTFQNTDTEMGLRTGVAFFEQARAVRPDLPVIILTNVSDEHVRERFISEDKCLYLCKEDYYPFELCTEVEQLLTGSSR